MMTDTELRCEIRKHYPKMTGRAAMRAQILADLNGVHECTVFRLMLSEDLLSDSERRDFSRRIAQFERKIAMEETMARIASQRAALAQA